MTPDQEAQFDYEDSVYTDITEAISYGVSGQHVSEPLTISFGELIWRYPKAAAAQIQAIIAGINRGHKPHVVAAQVLRKNKK